MFGIITLGVVVILVGIFGEDIVKFFFSKK